MDGNSVSSDQVLAELIGMGFEFSDAIEAIEAVGPTLDEAVDFILKGTRRDNQGASTSAKSSIVNGKVMGKRALSSSHSSGRTRQSSIMEHLKPAGRPKRSRTDDECNELVSGSAVLPKLVEGPKRPLLALNCDLENTPDMSSLSSYCKEEDIGPDWVQKVNNILYKHFRYSSLKSFQKEALSAWLAHQDCLVLAATGSGKSLCFQIPALLSGKVVVVISPLISLMHDQCLKLAKHGVSACFLGSGQPDSSVEQKAMRGMFGIIYVCPETILRLIKPLQSLAENRGIALFAIDEVHCVSKWGHDFRPDYRRLSILRETFRAKNLKFLKHDIPLMALTATATLRVREDILESLCLEKETKIVITSFFRPNLRFSVKHSRTSSPSSYETDFHELIETYTRKEKPVEKKPYKFAQDKKDVPDKFTGTSNSFISEADEMSQSDGDDTEDGVSSENDDEVSLAKENRWTASKGKKLSVEFLEDECDLLQDVDDLDVPCGEFYGQSPVKKWDVSGLSETSDPSDNPEERLKLLQGPLEYGSTIIYVPTRKETLSISKFLCQLGVKAAAYNAKLPKSHLRQVHKDFHENALQVVVATIAFGMGIDKLNVRRIIHYGWPQSLEAYYQEAGRAGRDGKLAHCVLYANLSRMPTLLPSRRSEDQTKQAYKMLSDCFRYGMGTSSCRANTLVEYFGEQFHHEKCLLCDVCVDGPPELQNFKVEADILMQVIIAHYGQGSFSDGLYDNFACDSDRQRKFLERPNIKSFVSKIREQFHRYTTTDLLWWRGLARILEAKGFIREADDRTHVQIKFPVPTELGVEFLQLEKEQSLDVYPEADMLLSTSNRKSFSTFSDWGRGWADPEIRRERLANRRFKRKPRKRKSGKLHPDNRTVRGRLAAKLTKQK